MDDNSVPRASRAEGVAQHQDSRSTASLSFGSRTTATSDAPSIEKNAHVTVTEIELAAETHYFVRGLLLRALDDYGLSADAAEHLARLLGTGTPTATYGDWWRANHSLDIFDVTTLLRLATGIESGLKAWYSQDPNRRPVSRGTFQRLDQKTLDQVTDATGHDLSLNPEWPTMREIMCHRHLYAHQGGILDQKYVTDLKALTGVDIRPDAELLGWVSGAIYWFRPLSQLGRFIESCRAFFRLLPAGQPGPSATVALA